MKAQVLLPKVFNFPFTYYNNQTSLRTGDFVEVPFGKNKEIGVVWNGNISDLKKIKIKNINKKINNFSLNKKLIEFIEWFAAYNMMPLGLVLKMSIGNNLNFIEKKDSYVVISPLVKMLRKKIKFDLKIKVICNINDQIKRVKLRDGLGKNIIEKIIAYQENNYELIQPDFIFDSSADLEEQIIQLKSIL